jgi:hypothetical protein
VIKLQSRFSPGCKVPDEELAAPIAEPLAISILRVNKTGPTLGEIKVPLR